MAASNPGGKVVEPPATDAALEDPASVPADRAAPAHHGSRARRISSVVMAVLGCILVPVAVIAVWLHNTVLDTDQYVSTMAPLASNPAIQKAAAHRVANAVIGSTDIEKRVVDVLPERASFLAPQISSGLRGYVESAALKIIESDRFATLWERANRVAHKQVVAVLEGGGSTVQTKNGKVVVDLGAVVDRVKTRLDSLGINVFDDVDTQRVNRQIVIADSATLGKAQDAVSAFDTLRVALPILAALALALAVALSTNRRRTVLRLALALGAILAVLIVVLDVARSAYLDALPSTVNHDAAAAVYDQVLHFLLTTLRAGFAFMLVVAVVAWFAGPASFARRVREGTEARLHRGGDAAPGFRAHVASWVRPLQLVAVGIGLVVLVALDHPGAGDVLLVAGVVLVVVVALEVFAPAATPSESG